jgi:hypothetical protein
LDWIGGYILRNLSLRENIKPYAARAQKGRGLHSQASLGSVAFTVSILVSFIERSGRIMSTALDAPHPHSSSKASCEEPQVTTAKYELDGIEDDIEDDNSPTSLRSGYTRHDQKDMRRMGKQQELMVSAECRRGHDMLTSRSECFVLFQRLVSPSSFSVRGSTSSCESSNHIEVSSTLTTLPARIIRASRMVAWLDFFGHISMFFVDTA